MYLDYIFRLVIIDSKHGKWYNVLILYGDVMAMTSGEKEKALAALLDYLSTNNEGTRKEIIEGALDFYGFSEKEKLNKSCNSKFNNVRSYVGSALTDMISDGTIIKKDDKYSLSKERAVVVKEEQCRNAILNFLRKKAYTKKDLYAALQKHFKTDKTKTVEDDNALKGLAGNLLRKLVDDGKVNLDDGNTR